MNIGTKINNLIKEHHITQEILAERVGVSQTKIHEIISGKTQKVDFLFMNKVCEVFQVGFDYFLDEVTTNNVKKAENCNIGCENGTINNSFPEGLLENMLKRIAVLEKKLD